MKRIFTVLIFAVILLHGASVFAEKNSEVVLCCTEDAYSADYVFDVGRNPDSLQLKVNDKDCMFDWNYIKSEAKLYIGIASAKPIAKCKAIADITADKSITLTPVSLKTNGKTADLSLLNHISADMPEKAPTCDLPGSSGGIFCSRCGVTLAEPTVLPATGPIVKATLSTDNVLTISGTLSDNISADGVVIAAVYGKNKLIKLFDISAQNQNSINFKTENITDADTVKIFRWESILNLKPIYGDIEVKISQKTPFCRPAEGRQINVCKLYLL